MWRPDRTLSGPDRATVADIDELNHVFSDAFTERYRRDGLSGVRVPHLNPAIWRYAIEDAAAGAMLWRNGRGEVVAFNMVHRSGTEGWMGPIAVRTDRQGSGVGRQIVLEAVRWLEGEGATTIGLETMPRTIENIGFYSRLGFRPGHLTITLQRENPQGLGVARELLSNMDPDARQAALEGCRALADRVVRGSDFTRELQLTIDHDLGDVAVLRDSAGAVRAYAMWHTAALAVGRARDELRLLKLAATDLDGARAAIAIAEAEAARLGLPRIGVRCQTMHGELYARLVADGFRVHWTDLRMTLAGREEPERNGVMLSNWEI